MEDNNNNKVCVRDANENTYVETDVCTNVKYIATPEICSKLKISGEGDETYACSKNSAEGSTDCIETNKCKEILYVKEEGDCSKFSISEENKDTHACIKNKESEATNCIETNICLEVTIGATDAQNLLLLLQKYVKKKNLVHAKKQIFARGLLM